MKIQSFQSANIFVISQTQDLAAGAIQIKSSAAWIRADDDVRCRFQNRGEAGMGRLRPFAFADLVLKRGDLFLQFLLGAVQRAVL